MHSEPGDLLKEERLELEDDEAGVYLITGAVIRRSLTGVSNKILQCKATYRSNTPLQRIM